MIGKIRGILIEKKPPELLIEIQGIGYEVSAPMGTFYQLPDLHKEITLFTHFVVREDGHFLYGFYTYAERLLFRYLLKVNGVGPRLALTILSSASVEEFVRAVLNNDTASLVRLPGIGKKTAERLVIEMRDRLSDWHETEMPRDMSSEIPHARGDRHHTLQDAIDALIALGYKPQEANRTVNKIDDGKGSSEELIRRALREIA